MSKYIVKKNVPILDEHDIQDDDGHLIAKVDEARLRHIAAKNNHRIAATGDLIPVVIGHTKDGIPEDQQPEIVGYARNLRVAPLFRTGRKAIHATIHFFKRAANKVRRFPRRSVELWLSDWKIDPISLLGATTPERDLGLLQLAADGRRIYKRIIPDMDPKKIVNEVLSALQQTDVWKWVKQQMEKEQGDEEGLDEPGLDDDLGLEDEEPGLGEEEMPGEEEPGLEDEDMDDEEPLDEEERGEVPVRRSAGSPPGGSNTYTPTSLPNKDRRRMQRHQNRSRLVRLERRQASLEHENQVLRKKYQRAERERDLTMLDAEGYVFDMVEELDHVMQMPEQEYRRHLNLMRKRYQRAPVGDPNFTPYTTTHGQSTGAQGRSREQATQIADYAAQKGISYAQAAQELAGDQTF